MIGVLLLMLLLLLNLLLSAERFRLGPDNYYDGVDGDNNIIFI